MTEPNDATQMQTDWHRVGAGLAVRFTMAGERFDAEWKPRPPTRREMRRVIDRYRGARDLFLAHVGQQRGAPVLVLEMPL